MTVRELIEALSACPEDAEVEAYEGEAIGLKVVGAGDDPFYLWIST